MRDYGKVAPTFWTGATGRAIRAEGVQAQVVALYLMTAPSSRMIGLYYLPLPTLSHETGLPLKGACKALRSLETVGFAFYDEPTETVWVPEMASFQIDAELKVGDNRVKGVLREIEQHKKTPFYDRFVARYGVSFNLGIAAPKEAPSKPLRSQEQDQEQERDLVKDTREAAEGRVTGADIESAWSKAGLGGGRPNLGRLLAALNELPPAQRPVGDLALAFCSAAAKYIAAYLEHKQVKIPAHPDRFIEDKHFGNIVEVMLGKFDVDKMASREVRKEPAARPRPAVVDGAYRYRDEDGE